MSRRTVRDMTTPPPGAPYPDSHSRPEPSRVPVRVQRRRTKGWRMPAGVVFVGRPSRWGNPYVMRKVTASEYVVLNSDGQELDASRGSRAFAAEYATDAYRAGFSSGVWAASFVVDELAGVDLSCWCPLDQPCHADVLLELANPNAESTHPASSVTHAPPPHES